MLILSGLACQLAGAMRESEISITATAQPLAVSPAVVSAPTTSSIEIAALPSAASTPTPVPILLFESNEAIVFQSGDYLCFGVPGEDTSIYLSNVSRVNRALVSDDGDVIVFEEIVDDYHHEIWAVNRDGSDLRLLLGTDDFDIMVQEVNAVRAGAEAALPGQVAWVAGTHKLMFNTRGVYGSASHNDLRMVDVDSLELSTLLPPGSNGGRFKLSPDGGQIALITPESISLIDSDGSNHRQDVLTFPYVVTDSEFWIYPDPVWAATSQSLLVVIPPANTFSPEATISIWDIHIDGSPPVRLATFPWNGGPSQAASSFSFSPDLTQIAFLTWTRSGSASLHVANVDGSQEVLFEGDNLSFEGWNDAESFFFWADGQRLLGQIDGSFETPLTPSHSTAIPLIEQSCER